jgi:uncharacterized protein (TIGR02246 family)
MLMRFFAILLLVVVFPTSVAAAPSDVSAPNSIPQAFSSAWARADGEALGELMAPDVDFVTVGGTWLHGRRDFSLYHSRLLKERFKGSSITPLQIKVRFIRPDLAFVRWSWRIVGDRNFDASARPPRTGIMSMLAQHRGRKWLVIASQNTNKMPGSPPEAEGLALPMVLPDK